MFNSISQRIYRTATGYAFTPDPYSSYMIHGRSWSELSSQIPFPMLRSFQILSLVVGTVMKRRVGIEIDTPASATAPSIFELGQLALKMKFDSGPCYRTPKRLPDKIRNNIRTINLQIRSSLPSQGRREPKMNYEENVK